MSSPATTAAAPSVLMMIPTAISSALVILAIVVPAGFTFLGLGPVWPSPTAAALVSLIISLAAAVGAYASLGKGFVKKMSIGALGLLTVGLLLYATLSAFYIVSVQAAGQTFRIQTGFELTPEAKAIRTPSYSKEEMLREFAMQPTMIWTSASVASAGVATLFSWLAFSVGLSVSATLISGRLFVERTLIKEREIQRATELVEREPERTRPTWELARLRLELYFDRNLSQVAAIFWLSLFVMLVGFGFVMFGIQRALVSQSSSTLVALISGVAGVITEFIGATFLFLYRSTVQQAAENIKTLERINAVGMAVAILDSISPTSGDLRDRTKAELVRLLLNTVGQRE